MEGYRKIKKLGKGTFGSVFLCEKNKNSPKIVLKEIYVTLDQKRIQQAKNEVKILKTLKHPNIVQYFRSYQSQNAFCIIMEYCNKGNLYEKILKQRNINYFEQEVVLNIFCQILHGLNHIHSKNIIHRDLKSENILITGYKNDVIKIADFGISKILLDTHEAQSQIGTTNYLAPEICNGKPYDIKSDMWALGCLLYEICALERMFDGSISNIVLSITTGNVKEIDLKKYASEIQDMINALLTMNPIFRPNTHGIARYPILAPTLMTIPLR